MNVIAWLEFKPESERIENAPLAILISTEQFELHACFGIIRRECAPFRGLPQDKSWIFWVPVLTAVHDDIDISIEEGVKNSD